MSGHSLKEMPDKQDWIPALEEPLNKEGTTGLSGHREEPDRRAPWQPSATTWHLK